MLTLEQENRYFEAIGSANGLNSVQENPCKLLDFNLLKLSAGQEWSSNSAGNEVLAVILGGKCSISVGSASYENIGKRPNVFGGKPYSVYVPPASDFRVVAGAGAVEVALCYAKAKEVAPANVAPFLIKPEQVDSGVWGAANFSRNFHGILVDNVEQPVHRLIVGETFTPSGNWSTYPPHKHEEEKPGQEVFMEEFYYFRSSAPEGFGLLKHYTDDGEIDNVYTVRDNSLLKVERGYHTYVQAPGYSGYYLWFLAGDHRTQNPATDSRYAWVQKTVPLLKQYGL